MEYLTDRLKSWKCKPHRNANRTRIPRSLVASDPILVAIWINLPFMCESLNGERVVQIRAVIITAISVNKMHRKVCCCQATTERNRQIFTNHLKIFHISPHDVFSSTSIAIAKKQNWNVWIRKPTFQLNFEKIFSLKLSQ